MEELPRLFLGVLLKGNAANEPLLIFVELANAGLYVVDKDHNIIKAMHNVVGDLAPKQVLAEKRGYTTRFH